MPNLPSQQPPTGTGAMELQTWFDPPLRTFWGPGKVNWWAAIVDPVLKTPLAPPSGGAIQFMWTQPPVVNTPQIVPNVFDALGLYYAIWPLTVTMYGKLLAQVVLTDSGGAVVDQVTSELFVYPSGQ